MPIRSRSPGPLTTATPPPRAAHRRPSSPPFPSNDFSSDARPPPERSPATALRAAHGAPFDDRSPQFVAMPPSTPASTSLPRYPHLGRPVPDPEHPAPTAAVFPTSCISPSRLQAPLRAWRRGMWSETLLGRCRGEQTWTATVHH
ncbi:hypothetical protein SORBI_3009G008400 [Sorghum bicolor]|uniref:Uncharacterized protein n=1 Tax=Sorghum bicolor TaxID=4558 RepID=A0A1B6P5P9_SORBI|nr:hypothetical protein SORBI_3009G008400 [Sorghum bicolor]